MRLFQLLPEIAVLRENLCASKKSQCEWSQLAFVATPRYLPPSGNRQDQTRWRLSLGKPLMDLIVCDKSLGATESDKESGRPQVKGLEQTRLHQNFAESAFLHSARKLQLV